MTNWALQSRAATGQPLHRAFSTGGDKKQPVEEPEHDRQEQHHDQNNARKKSPVTWATVLATGLLGAMALGFYQYDRKKQAQKVGSSTTIGKARIGGTWDLTEHNGKKVASKDLFGKHVLIYFGFTYCPDICPVELKKMKEVMDNLEKSGLAGQVQPIFISIDPGRDTPERLAVYKKEWDSRMRWFTGSHEDIAAVAKKFRMYYSVPEIKDGEDHEYLVDHSIFFYLMDEQGEFSEFFGKNFSAEEVTIKIAQKLK
jgi:protein SCO1/2